MSFDKCPQCGGETESDEVDVGCGIIQGPRGCPSCHWVEGDAALALTASAGLPPKNPPPVVLSAIDGETCKECRHVGTHKRKKIMSATGFGDQMMFEDADKDETVYTCKAFEIQAVLGAPVGKVRDLTEEETDGPIVLQATFETRVTGSRALCEHAGKEIGLVPITCSAWAPVVVSARSERLAELDRLIAQQEARAAKREQE